MSSSKIYSSKNSIIRNKSSNSLWMTSWLRGPWTTVLTCIWGWRVIMNQITGLPNCTRCLNKSISSQLCKQGNWNLTLMMSQFCSRKLWMQAIWPIRQLNSDSSNSQRRHAWSKSTMMVLVIMTVAISAKNLSHQSLYNENEENMWTKEFVCRKWSLILIINKTVFVYFTTRFHKVRHTHCRRIAQNWLLTFSAFMNVWQRFQVCFLIFNVFRLWSTCLALSFRKPLLWFAIWVGPWYCRLNSLLKALLGIVLYVIAQVSQIFVFASLGQTENQIALVRRHFGLILIFIGYVAVFSARKRDQPSLPPPTTSPSLAST